jgi:hypothetical protein
VKRKVRVLDSEAVLIDRIILDGEAGPFLMTFAALDPIHVICARGEG